MEGEEKTLRNDASRGERVIYCACRWCSESFSTKEEYERHRVLNGSKRVCPKMVITPGTEGIYG